MKRRGLVILPRFLGYFCFIIIERKLYALPGFPIKLVAVNSNIKKYPKVLFLRTCVQKPNCRKSQIRATANAKPNSTCRRCQCISDDDGDAITIIQKMKIPQYPVPSPALFKMIFINR